MRGGLDGLRCVASSSRQSSGMRKQKTEEKRDFIPDEKAYHGQTHDKYALDRKAICTITFDEWHCWDIPSHSPRSKKPSTPPYTQTLLSNSTFIYPSCLCIIHSRVNFKLIQCTAEWKKALAHIG